MNGKIVNIYIKTKYDYNSKCGHGIILLEYKGRQKKIYFSTIETTSNREIIIAAIYAIELLKESCEINLYLQTNIGFKFFDNQKKWVNRDLGDQLMVIRQGNYIVNPIDCSHYEKGVVIQKALEKKLKSINNDSIIVNF